MIGVMLVCGKIETILLTGMDIMLDVGFDLELPLFLF